MRIELLQHAVDGAVHQAVRREFVDVLLPIASSADVKILYWLATSSCLAMRLPPSAPPAIAESTTARIATGKNREVRMSRIVTDEVS